MPLLLLLFSSLCLSQVRECKKVSHHLASIMQRSRPPNSRAVRSEEGAAKGGRKGSYACAWVPTTNSQRMRKLVVVLGLRMRMRLAVRLFSDHLIGALLCPLQHSAPSPSLLPCPPLCSSLSTSTPSFVWPGPFSGRSYLPPAPFLRCPYPAWVFRFLALLVLLPLCANFV